MEKRPRNIRRDWKPNHDEMRELMLKAAILNEENLANGEERYYPGRQDNRRRTSRRPSRPRSPSASERSHVGTKSPVLGSSDLVTDTKHDAGFLSTVYEAYSNHYNLRTSPEDWWYTIIQTVALAIDDNSKSDAVRKFFVQHEGKKTIQVDVKPDQLKNISGIDYSWLFDQFSEGIERNINVPEYVQQMIPDFSTTTSVHRIVSQITLMTSVQEFFEYRVNTICGIPAIEMKGTLEDWMKLKEKIKALGKTLEPILSDIELEYGVDLWGRNYFTDGYDDDLLWFERIEKIADKLIETFKGNPDEDFWSRIITEKRYGSGGPTFKGWFMNILLNKRHAKTIGSAPSGLVSIPMKFGAEESAVIAGIMGYKFHPETNITRPAIEAMHGWTLLLEPDSPRRKYLTDWEQKVNGLDD